MSTNTKNNGQRTILVVNAGSSSIKLRIFGLQSGVNTDDTPKLDVLFKATASAVGKEQTTFSATVMKGDDSSDFTIDNLAGDPVTTHGNVFSHLLDQINLHHPEFLSNLHAIGHRIVHGGTRFLEPTILDEQKTLPELEDLSILAPLHNAAAVQLIKKCFEMYPSKSTHITQVGVFDTAFHQTMPEATWRYALPYEPSERHHIRKYGFHGISHAYVSRTAASFTGNDKMNIISLHLGNGSSACAIRAGKSIDCSMGYTPVSGLLMASRCGDVDPVAAFHMFSEDKDDKTAVQSPLTERVPVLPSTDISDDAPGHKGGHKVRHPTVSRVEEILNRESGLKGICGESNIKNVIEIMDGHDKSKSKEDRDRARLAFDMFCYRITTYIGSYHTALNPAHCILFTGGIGEHSARARKRVLESLSNTLLKDVEIDWALNDELSSTSEVKSLTRGNDGMRVLVVPTDEEFEIANDVMQLVHISE
ncbi:Acetokinase family-domain-containing protein [Phlyctochytrium arcticum]|nr:Acetokinase family-domain-containing protein [Phlyctochytrium arcticum]